MRPVDVILAKRRGQRHSRAELERFLGGYLAGEVADYQVSAWLMAVCFSGMDDEETADLTQVMAESGDTLDLSSLKHTVDKHSTGGVGDKTSLVLAPLLAEAGATVAKMSGRGLGHTGGTVDKLESIPGFRSELSDDEFLRQAREVGVVVSGQSREMAPADGLLYSLRDATGTVDSLPLIASSIMSKKLAGGARSLVLDVKVGSGAFLRTREEALRLARMMIAIGAHAGRNVRVVLSSMEQPLGRAVGNSLEVAEAMACLRGDGPEDLTELCLALAEQVLTATGLPHSREQLVRLLAEGRAYERFEKWIEAQGGDVRALSRLGPSTPAEIVTATRSGRVSRVDALAVGRAVGILGGGRARKGDDVDRDVGVVIAAKVGDSVSRGDPLLTIYHRDRRGLDEAMAEIEGAVEVGDEAVPAPLILGVVEDR